MNRNDLRPASVYSVMSRREIPPAAIPARVRPRLRGLETGPRIDRLWNIRVHVSDAGWFRARSPNPMIGTSDVRPQAAGERHQRPKALC
jgi:hypothetical protein